MEDAECEMLASGARMMKQYRHNVATFQIIKYQCQHFGKFTIGLHFT